MRAGLAKLVEENKDEFLTCPESEYAHAVAVAILSFLQEMTPGCSTPSVLTKTDPWLDQDPALMSEEEHALARAHRQSVSFESLGTTLWAIRLLGKAAEAVLTMDDRRSDL